MKKRIALLLLAMVIPSAQAANDKNLPPDNAALFYWQAFALLPDIKDDGKQQIRQWGRMELTEDIRKGALQADFALSYLHQGSQLPNCNWHINWQHGFGALMPHLGKAVLAARINALKGRILLENGDSETAAVYFLAGLAFTRHIGADPVIVSLATRQSIEDGYYDYLLSNLTRFSSKAQKRLQDGLIQLPPPTSLSEVVEFEQQIIRRTVSQPIIELNHEFKTTDLKYVFSLLEAFDASVDQLDPRHITEIRATLERIEPKHFEALRKIVPLPETKPEALALWSRVEAFIQNTGDETIQPVRTLFRGLLTDDAVSLEEAGKMAQEIKELQAEIIAISRLPPEAFEPRYKAFEERLKQTGSLARQLLPDIGTLYINTGKNTLKKEILLGSLAYVAGDRKALEPLKKKLKVEVGEHALKFEHSTFSVQANLASAPPQTREPLAANHALHKAQAEFRQIVDHQATEKISRGLEKELKRIFQDDPNLELSRDEAEKALAILTDGVVKFASTWLPIIEDGIASDGSARTAGTIVMKMQHLERPLLRWAMREERPKLIQLLGQEKMAYIQKKIER